MFVLSLKSRKGDGRLMCIASDFIRGPKKRGGHLSDSGRYLGTLRYVTCEMTKYIAACFSILFFRDCCEFIQEG